MNKEQLDKGNKIGGEIELAGERLGLLEVALERVTSSEFGSGTNEKCVLVICHYQGGAQSESIHISPETMVSAIKLAETQIQKELNQLTKDFENL